MQVVRAGTEDSGRPQQPAARVGLVAPHPPVTGHRPSAAVRERQPDAPQATLPPADTRPLELHYALDPVGRMWVANVVDPTTGEVLRQVPSTEVLHALAAAGRRRPLDTRA